MTRGFRKSLMVSASFLAATYASHAAAQSDIPVSPIKSSVDANGVDLLSGKVIFDRTDISIGPSDTGGLAFRRQWINRGWRPTMVPVLTGNSANPVVTFDGVSASFTNAGSVWVPDTQDGSQFVVTSGTATYTRNDGLTIEFVINDGYSYYDGAFNWGRPTVVTFPNGAKWRYGYNTTSYTETIIDEECTHNCTPTYIERYWKRLSSITSSAGYQLKFTHASDSLTDEESLGLWLRLSRVTGINNAVESCSPTANTCSLTGSWPHADYSYPTYGLDPSSVTDAGGQVWTFQQQSTREMTGILRPSSSTSPVTYAYTSGKVSSVIRGGGTWGYSYGSSSTTVTDPLSNTRVLSFDATSLLVSSDQDENTKTVSYLYCQSTDTNCPVGLLKTATQPETNSTSYEYDTRGNVTKTTLTPKSGSSLSAIIASATFPSSCSNIKTCNQPTTTTDPRGAVTDYTYDSTHGGVLTVTSPAATSGAPRPEVRFGYTAITNSVSGDSVYEPTGKSVCRSTASCTGTADETKVTIGYSTSNLLPTSQTVAAGDASLSAGSTFSYDDIGNLVTVDGPLSGTADTTRINYDALRRRVMVISPDPDGSGPRSNRAVQFGFDAQSRPNSVAIGASNSTGSSFTVSETRTSTFDSADRKIADVVTSGSTTYAATQYSYDTKSRLDCAAVRMNPTVFGSLPSSACTAGTAGSYGADRITKVTLYDAVDRPKEVTSAYGTAGASIEKTDYTDNGKLAAATDAEGNKTTYEYDGVDRLVKTRYPSTTFGAGTSSTTDYEQLTYDAGSNVTIRRLRDNTSIGATYDALGRVTLLDLSGSGIDQDITYTYNLQGRMLTSTNVWGHITNFGYDALGRVVTEATTFAGGNKTSTYDAAGRRTRLTWWDGFYVDYDYDVTGNMTAVRENGATSGVGLLATYGYDDLGRRTSLTRGNGVTTSYGYDAVSRLTSLASDLSSTTYDVTTTLSYNPASQIASTTRSNDAYAWAGAANVNRGYTTNGLNQFTASGSTSLYYDALGNLSVSGSDGYAYSQRNQLYSYAIGSTSGGLYYDPPGRLDLIYGTGVTTTFDYDGDRLSTEATYGVTTVDRRYMFGAGTDEPLVWYEGSGTSDRRWLVADERGSIVAVTNSSGAATAINTYDEYGIPGSSNQGRFQYTGQAWMPELGMYYYKARMYSPTLGRFMQTDPIGYGDGMNWYNYVKSDPVNKRDPKGTWEVCDENGKNCYDNGQGPDIPVCGNCGSSSGNLRFGLSLINPFTIFAGREGSASGGGLTQNNISSLRCRIVRGVFGGGKGTVQLGLAGTAALGLGAVTTGGGVAIDRYGNVGLYGFYGGGGGGGEFVGGGGSAQISNADGIQNLSGLFTNYSGSGGAGPAGTLDGFFGPSAGGAVTGFGITGGGGEGIGAFSGVTNTQVIPLLNVKSAMGCPS